MTPTSTPFAIQWNQEPVFLTSFRHAYSKYRRTPLFVFFPLSMGDRLPAFRRPE